MDDLHGVNEFEVHEAGFDGPLFIIKLPPMSLSTAGTLPPPVIKFTTKDGNTQIARWEASKHHYVLVESEGIDATVVKEIKRWVNRSGRLYDADTIDVVGVV